MDETSAGIESELLDLSTKNVATLRSVELSGITEAMARVRERIADSGRQHQRLQRLVDRSSGRDRFGSGSSPRLTAAHGGPKHKIDPERFRSLATGGGDDDAVAPVLGDGAQLAADGPAHAPRVL